MPAREGPPSRRRRRAVGPPGAARDEGQVAWTGGEVLADVVAGDEPPEGARGSTDDDRLTADRPPHHDRGV